MRVEGDRNSLGALSVGVPGTLKGWCEALERFGRLDLPTVLRPAIRHATHGLRATHYLCEAIQQCAGDLARFPDSAVFLPGGAPPRPGGLIVQPAYVESLRAISDASPQAMYGSELGRVICESIRENGGILTLDDLRAYATVDRQPIYRQLPRLHGGRTASARGRRHSHGRDAEPGTRWSGRGRATSR